MASILGPKYLRVRQPRTSDGQTLVQDSNGQTLYDETELPLSALKHLERRNKKLSNPLKLKFTVIDETENPDEAKISKLVKGVGIPAMTKEQQKEKLKAKLAELEGEPSKKGAKKPAEELV